jgi:hypothetical protein
MKLIKSLFAIAFFFAVNTISAQSVVKKWPQLNEFQELLVKTFEPAGEGNFGPIKNSCEYLVEKSQALDIATMPQDLRNAKAEETISVLKRQTKLVAELVRTKASNVEIMKAFQKLNETYDRFLLLYEPKK